MREKSFIQKQSAYLIAFSHFSVTNKAYSQCSTLFNFDNVRIMFVVVAVVIAY